MKRTIITALVGTSALLFVACNRNDEPATPGSTNYQDIKSDVRQGVDNMADNTADAWNDLKTYTADRKDEFANGMERQIQRLDTQIQEMRQSSSRLTGASKERYDDALDNIDDKREDLVEKLDDIGDATAENWNDFKGEVAEAWEALKKSVADARTAMVD